MKNILLILAAFLFIFVNTASPQFYEKTRLSGSGNPYFEARIFRTFSKDLKSGTVYVYSNIVNDDLTFIKNDSTGGYKAAIDWEVAFIDQNDDRQVGFKSIRKEVNEADYQETNNREKSILLSTNIDLPAGEYTIAIQMRDLMSKKVVSRKIEDIEMDNLKQSGIDLSDILFLNEADVDSIGNNVDQFVPRVKDNFSRDIPYLYLYTEIYSNKYPTTVNLEYIFENNDEEAEVDTVVVKDLTASLTPQILKIKESRITKNKYKCIVKLKKDDETIERSRPISFYWVNMPETASDIGLALRQMQYIVSVDSLDTYEDASPKQMKAFFERFWARRDPNPETKGNELMQEYFSRVNYANREFSSFTEDGWLSDRGRILIKFGVPDDIERHPFEVDSYPYVIWRYYSLRRTFLFVDRTGFGEYRLDPRYQSEEYR